MRLNGMKFGQDQKVEFKKSYELYCQILLKNITKVGSNYIHFAWAKVSKMKPRDDLGSNSPFSSKDQNLTNIQ
jgi:hypothetical protein